MREMERLIEFIAVAPRALYARGMPKLVERQRELLKETSKASHHLFVCLRALAKYIGSTGGISPLIYWLRSLDMLEGSSKVFELAAGFENESEEMLLVLPPDTLTEATKKFKEVVENYGGVFDGNFDLTASGLFHMASKVLTGKTRPQLKDPVDELEFGFAAGDYLSAIEEVAMTLSPEYRRCLLAHIDSAIAGVEGCGWLVHNPSRLRPPPQILIEKTCDATTALANLLDKIEYYD